MPCAPSLQCNDEAEQRHDTNGDEVEVESKSRDVHALWLMQLLAARKAMSDLATGWWFQDDCN